MRKIVMAKSDALLAAVVANGLLAGASLDQSIEQLPARHRIGDRAYSDYSRASHLANGRFWLVPLGLGGPLLTIGAALASRSRLSILAAALSVAHLLSTAKAAPLNLTQWRPDVDDAKLAAILDDFERWQALRAALQFLTFAVSACALRTSRTDSASPPAPAGRGPTAPPRGRPRT